MMGAILYFKPQWRPSHCT